MKKVRVGILGCNFMGIMHASCYKQIEAAEVVAVADLNEEVAASLAAPFGAKVYTDAKALLRECELDLLDICLPTFLHKEYAEAAMGRLPYIIIEKPVTLTKEEGEALLEKQRETGAQVGVGHVVRFFKEYEYLKQAIDDGRYGRLVNLAMHRHSPSPSWDFASWRKNSKLSGGAILDLHIHDVDFMLHALGDPLRVHSAKNTLCEQNSYIATVCEYESFVVSLEGTWFLPASFPFNAYFRAAFENAVLEYDRETLTLYEQGGSSVIPFSASAGHASEGIGNLSKLDGYMEELSYFVGCAEAGLPIERATLADSVHSLGFIEKYCL